MSGELRRAAIGAVHDMEAVTVEPSVEQYADAVLAVVAARLAAVEALDVVWGVADIDPDGHVNPSAVEYASSREAAIRKAEMWGKAAVTRHVTEWAAVLRPVSSEAPA